MLLNPETCYRAVKSRDARFDGRFFICVSSTRIYCRPICTVKAPKRENCTYCATAAEAESAGYRPCMRCRPELAPGNASVDARFRLAHAAAQLIEEGAFQESRLPVVAAQLGVTPRHLRRTFHSEWGVSPVEFAQTQRLLLAKRLLTDTALPVTEIAYAAGFGSLRRFEALFQERYRLSPKQLRKNPKLPAEGDALHFTLGFRPPYDWNGLITFLANRCIAGVDEVEDSRYRRIMRIARDSAFHTGWIEIAPNGAKPTFTLLVSHSLKKVLPAVLARVKNLTDVCCNPGEVSDRLGPLAAGNPGLRVPGSCDGFEIAIRAIVGQQISVKGARTLLGRIVARFGTPVDFAVGGLSSAFPLAEDIASLSIQEVAAIGMPESRARSIVEMAKAVASRDIRLSTSADVEATTERLKSLPGVGEWTAQYIAMRALRWPDAFPHTDLVLMKALDEKSPRRVLAAAERWRPWRSYAVMHLWSHANGSVR